MAQRKNTLSARWSKAREHGVSRLNDQMGDVLYEWGEGCKSADGSLLHWVLGCEHPRMSTGGMPMEWDQSFLKELHARGYDLTTLRFSIRKRQSPAAGRGNDAGQQVTIPAPESKEP
jgi:hypothetical protein